MGRAIQRCGDSGLFGGTLGGHYLIDRFGMSQVRELLLHLKARQALSTAMQSQLSLSYEQFQSRWEDQLPHYEKKS